MSAWRARGGVQVYDIIKTAKEHIGVDWTVLARHFNMSKTDIDSIRSDYRDNLKEQIHQFFELWERQNGDDATTEKLVEGLVSCLTSSDVVIHLKKESLITRRGVGGSMPSFSPTQVKESLPCQESSPTNFLPAQETQSHTNFHGATVELDSPADGVSKTQQSPRCGDDERTRRKIKRLRMIEHDKTGEGPYDLNSVIKTEEGYGIVTCFFLTEDERFMVGIELEEPTALGNDGVYLGKRHFSCERRCGIFVPYDTLQPDTRFSSETQENEQSCVTKQEDVEVAEMLEAVPTIEGRTDLCKLPGCSSVRFRDLTRSYDYCSKRHAEIHKEIGKPVASPNTSMVIRTIRIAKDRTGMVIGKNGRNIAKIEAETDTHIKLDKSWSNEDTQIHIAGKEDNCAHAIVKISECISMKTAMHTATSRTISVQASSVGRVIGRHGSTLQFIKAESEVQSIEFDKPQTGFDAAVNSTRKCTIIGSEEQIEKAIGLIKRAENGEDFVTQARLVHMFSNLGVQVDPDSETVHKSDECVIS